MAASSARNLILLGCVVLWARSADCAISPIPTSARPFGMGGAFVSVANDFNAIFYNPAGLGQVQQRELAAGFGRHAAPGAAQSELYGAAALPLRGKGGWIETGTAGILLSRNGRSGDNDYTNLNFYWGSSLAEMVSQKAVLKRVPLRVPVDRIYAGLALRFRQIHRYGSGEINRGAGVDLGLLYQLPEFGNRYADGWAAGLAIQELNSGSVSSAATFRLGASWKSPPYLATLDVVTREGISKFLPGFEMMVYKKLLFVRAGYAEAPDQPRQLAFGLGVLLTPLQLDAAYGLPTGEVGKPNDRVVFSLTYRFGTPFFSQYLNPTDRNKAAELENEIADLEFKRKSMEAGVRDREKLFQKMDGEAANVQGRLAAAQTRLVELEQNIENKRKEEEKLLIQVQTLEARRDRLGIGLPSRPTPAKHRVMKGDTLRDLAQKYYGDPNLWKKIYDANIEKMIRGAPRVGEILNLP